PASTPFPYTTLFRSLHRTRSQRCPLQPVKLSFVINIAFHEEALGQRNILFRAPIASIMIQEIAVTRLLCGRAAGYHIDRKSPAGDRKSTRLNSSHVE